MNTIAMKDGTQTYYKDWGFEQSVMFSYTVHANHGLVMRWILTPIY